MVFSLLQQPLTCLSLDWPLGAVPQLQPHVQVTKRGLMMLCMGRQVLLPASVGAELMRQDASKNGAQLFELASATGRCMHAGVLLAALASVT